MTSDEIVESLQPYGVIYIHQVDNDKTFGAKCSLFMHGMKSVVRSDWHHPTMLSALSQLQSRVFDTLESVLDTLEPVLDKKQLEKTK